MDGMQGWASLPGGVKASVTVWPDGTIQNTSGVTIPAGSLITIDSAAIQEVAADEPAVVEG